MQNSKVADLFHVTFGFIEKQKKKKRIKKSKTKIYENVQKG